MKKILFLISIIWAPFLSNAQTDSLPDLEAYFSAIIVNDMDTSINWYSNVLGFKILNKTESEERGFSQANLKRGNVLIELIELNISVSPEDLLVDHPKKTKITGFFKFGFMVTEFDSWIDSLHKSSVNFHGSIVTDDSSGKRMVIILDPDGNRIQLFEKSP